MRLGSFRLRPNHPTIVVGSTGFVDDPVDLQLAEFQPPRLVEHVLVPIRGQVAPTDVVIWHSVAPVVGANRFTGDLRLPDGRLAVFDVENLTKLIVAVGDPGDQNVAIFSNDDRYASRVDVVVDPKGGEIQLTQVDEYPLPDVRGLREGEATEATLLSLILADRDIPFSRLVNAVAILAKLDSNEGARHKEVRALLVQWVVGWLWELMPGLKFQSCVELQSLLEGPVTASCPAQHAELASKIWKVVQEGGSVTRLPVHLDPFCE